MPKETRKGRFSRFSKKGVWGATGKRGVSEERKKIFLLVPGGEGKKGKHV